MHLQMEQQKEAEEIASPDTHPQTHSRPESESPERGSNVAFSFSRFSLSLFFPCAIPLLQLLSPSPPSAAPSLMMLQMLLLLLLPMLLPLLHCVTDSPSLLLSISLSLSLLRL